MQWKLLVDFSFRCHAVQGTQGIDKQIGHLQVWASLVYGNGIFIIISPGERDNYLAIA